MGVSATVIAAKVFHVVASMLLFQIRPGRRSLIVILITGYLFLPIEREPFKLGPFLLSKINTIGLVCVAASLCFNLERWRSFRFHWVDLPIVVWCLCPIPSVFSNDPPPDGTTSSLHDAMSQCFNVASIWGVPYLLGRLYLSGRKGLRDLAYGMVLGGLAYVPFCWYEVRFSPQLHNYVYGYHAHDFSQTVRYGGFRPTVFLDHGLPVGLWMVCAAVTATWLFVGRARAERQGFLGPAPTLWMTGLLVGTAVVVKSTGALGLGAFAIVVLTLSIWLRSRLLFVMVLLVFPLFVVARGLNVFDPEQITGLLMDRLDSDRAGSFEFRRLNENLLIERALEKPVFGWGGWGRNRIYDESGKDNIVTDSFWILTFGINGFFGLAVIATAILLPVALFLWNHPTSSWLDPLVAPAVAIAMVLTIWMLDNLLNSFFNPVYIFGLGGLASLPSSKQQTEPPPSHYSTTSPRRAADRRVARPGILVRQLPN